jgi:oxygen-independent coproporphyrinogen-3 oxidase
MAGLYIHIPFCKQACHYCDFHFSTNQSLKLALVQAMANEIRLQQQYLDRENISTIYFGGGTPSLLSQEELQLIFGSVHQHFVSNANPEVTLEANPDDLTEEKISMLRTSGINRLSIGIQTFHDELLYYLNRAHQASAAIASFHAARSAGFANISIDLMYAIPGQTEQMWEKDIEEAIRLNPEHISCYSLTIEPKTAFGQWSKTGKLKLVEDDIAARHLEVLIERLVCAGYEHYEISNFAKPGYYSKHNSSYWRQTHYLGIGPSAHSYNGVSRQYNIANNHQYLKSLQRGEIPFQRETLSRDDLINEYILTTLRTHWGCDVAYLKKHYDYDMLTDRQQYLSDLFDKKIALLSGSIITLTQKGKLLADKIASDLFLPA